MKQPPLWTFLYALIPCSIAFSQTPSLDQILVRLDRLEQENRSLRGEVSQLRNELAAIRGASPVPPPSVQSLDERLSIQERRTDEHAQTKVEAAQRFPIRLSGMVLANLFHNGPYVGGNDHPTRLFSTAGRQTGGITFRQSIVGFQYRGGRTVLGADVRASAFLDFFDGLAETNNFYPVRVRTASIELDWATRSFSIVQDKPLFSPRDPSSFSYQGVSPLTASGNLWRWQPQVRFEQRWGDPQATLARAQVALIQTSEASGAGANPVIANLSFAPRRPGIEGRFEIGHRREGSQFAVAPGFHASNSRVASFDVPSRLVSVDWLFSPVSKIEFTGLFWTGRNVHHFGALGQSFRIVNGRPEAVRSKGGWAQLAFPFTDRVTLNIFGGIHDDRNSDLTGTAIGANRTGAVNIQYRLAPNVIVSLEALQLRTTFLNTDQRKNNRYDLGVAYLF
jgi:hypothetical protein